MLKISTALKRKNKLKLELSRLRERIGRHNSVPAGRDRPYDIMRLQRELTEKTDDLIDLKMSLFLANAPIQRLIFEMSELKGLIKFYRSLNTQADRPMYYPAEETRSYDIALTEVDVDLLVTDLENRIDTIQERLDTYNTTTELP